jgi:hypothetical protein
MSKNPTDKGHRPASFETQGDQQKEKANQRFLSDEDIVGRVDRSRRDRRRAGVDEGKEPKFVSDEDIIRRVA